MPSTRWLENLSVVAAVLAVSSSQVAFAGPTSCYFSTDDPAHFGVSGDSADLAANGYVTVVPRGVYYTPNTIDVGVWVDDTMLDLADEIPALVLSYFEHANCIFALGKNKLTGDSIHTVSLRIAGNRIRYFPINTPPPVNQTAPWVQQVHWDWKEYLDSHAGLPKVNLLFTAGGLLELGSDGWTYVGGASNGIGQGQAIVGVDKTFFRDGMTSGGVLKDRAEDWWGVLAAHELGHALGFGGHVPQQYDTMCCTAGNDYAKAAKGTLPSSQFSVWVPSLVAWVNNDVLTADYYRDPWAAVMNPVTFEYWDYDQISDFLRPYSTSDAIFWATHHANCRSDPKDASGIQCKTLAAYSQCLIYFPYSPNCNINQSTGRLTEPCCYLAGGW